MAAIIGEGSWHCQPERVLLKIAEKHALNVLETRLMMKVGEKRTKEILDLAPTPETLNKIVDNIQPPEKGQRRRVGSYNGATWK